MRRKRIAVKGAPTSLAPHFATITLMDRIALEYIVTFPEMRRKIDEIFEDHLAWADGHNIKPEERTRYIWDHMLHMEMRTVVGADPGHMAWSEINLLTFIRDYEFQLILTTLEDRQRVKKKRVRRTMTPLLRANQ